MNMNAQQGKCVILSDFKNPYYKYWGPQCYKHELRKTIWSMEICFGYSTFVLFMNCLKVKS